jgi:hypothetical protein
MPQASPNGLPIIPQVKYAWQHQPDNDIVQVNPVQNTWYNILPATDDVRIISIGARIITTGEDIEGRIIIDGVTIDVPALAFPANAGHGVYNGYFDYPFYLWSTTVYQAYRSFLLEGQNVQVDIRKTTNAGNGDLWGRVKWAKLLPT